MIAGNMIGGGVKLPVYLASHLAEWHDVTLTYPLVPHYTTYHRLQRTSGFGKMTYIGRELYRHCGEFLFRRELGSRVRLKKYFLVPDENSLRDFDVIIYVSVWQHHEIKALDLKNVRKIHWTLADYLFCSSIVSSVDDILAAFTSGDMLVAPSERTGADLERYGLRVEAVIHAGVDSIFQPGNRKWNDGAPKLLGYFQPGWWVKGAATLVQCMRRIRHKFPKLEIGFVGHQNSAIQETGSLVCDRFYTGLSSADIAQLYREHDVFVYPSYSDGFQSPPIEAMACGCAVVATSVGAAPDYIDHDVNALLCTPMDYQEMCDQVERLILDSELRLRLGQEAVKVSTLWTWRSCAMKFDSLLRQCV